VKQTRNHIGALLVLALVPAANGLAAESPKTDEDCRRDDGCNRDGRCLARAASAWPPARGLQGLARLHLFGGMRPEGRQVRAHRGSTLWPPGVLPVHRPVLGQGRASAWRLRMRLPFRASAEALRPDIARNGQCVVPAQTSEECSQPHGKARFAPCELGGGQCTARTVGVRPFGMRSASDHRMQGARPVHGQERLVPGHARRRLQASQDVRAERHVRVADDRCTVGSDSDCAKTTDCKKFSHCTFADGGCMSGTVKAMSAITGKVCACKDAKCLSKVKATFDKIRKDLDEKGTEADRQTLQAMVARASECMDKLDAPKQPDVKSLETEF